MRLPATLQLILTNSMKFLALDFGAKRLGLALSDEDGRFSFPHGTYTRKPNDNNGDVSHLMSLIRAQGVQGLVLGIPSGSEASDKTAAQARRFAEKLRLAAQEAGIALQLFEQDERFSTSLAAQSLRDSGVSSRAAREGGLFDAGAAAAFLQTFLDKRQATQTNYESPPQETPDSEFEP
jgi:putative holliday junction resolvase